MEFDKDLYKRACSRLTAPPEKMQEVIAMTEKQNKARKWTRRMLVAIGVTALAVLAAMGANAASGGELFARIVSYVEYDTESGTQGVMTLEIDDGALTGANGSSYTIHMDEETGKTLMTYTDESGREVTQEIDLDQLPTPKPAK